MRRAALPVLVLVSTLISAACASTTTATPALLGPSFSLPSGAVKVNIATPARDVSWIAVRGDEYMLFRTSDGYRLYGSISCAGKPPLKTSASTDGFAVLACPDGSTWQMDALGESGGSGDASANDPPPEWPVFTAGGGTLTAYVVPGYFPPGTGGAS